MTISLERIHEEYCAAKIRSGYKSRGKFREIKRFVDFIKCQGVEHISYKIAMEFQEFRRTIQKNYPREVFSTGVLSNDKNILTLGSSN